MTIAGSALALLVLADVFLTVLHMDRDGPVARLIVRVAWKASLFVARRISGLGSTIRGLAGPLAIASIFAAWVALFVLAFALIYWPHADALRAEPELGSLGFVDVVYFSGNVSTVLGLGDIGPLDPGLQIVTAIQAALGFGVFTAGMTYLINVIMSAGRRNALTQRLWIESRRTGDGVEGLLRQLDAEEVTEVHARFRSLVTAFYEVEEQLRRLPVIDLLYRSGSREHPPELMLRSSGTLAIAAGILSSSGGRMRALATVARELADVVTLIMRNATVEWFGPDVVERFERAEPSAADRRWMAETRARLADHLPLREHEPRAPSEGEDEAAPSEGTDDPWLELRTRLRIFMEEARERMIWTG